MINHPQTFKDKQSRGFTLFIAILITGTLLLVSMAIIALAVKEAILTSSGRESQYAFYAADTGAECAIYWDIKNPAGVSAFSTSTPLDSSSRLISCLEATFRANRVVSGQNGTSTFTVNFSNFSTEPYCAVVSVAKTGDGKTKIESLGYNTCSPLNPRKVERAVRVTY